MIAERAEELKRKLGGVVDAQRKEQLLQLLQQRVQEVQSLKARAAEAARLLSSLPQDGPVRGHLPVIEQAIDIASSHSRIRESWESLQEDRELLIGLDDRAYRRTYEATRGVCTKLRSTAERAWREFTREAIPADHDPILKVFEDSVAERVGELRGHLERLTKLRDIDMPGDSEIQEFVETVERYQQGFSVVLGGDIPTAVRRALTDASRVEGAPLGAFNEDVKAWLQERGVEDAFRVVSRSM